MVWPYKRLLPSGLVASEVIPGVGHNKCADNLMLISERLAEYLAPDTLHNAA